MRHGASLALVQWLVLLILAMALRAFSLCLLQLNILAPPHPDPQPWFGFGPCQRHWDFVKAFGTVHFTHRTEAQHLQWWFALWGYELPAHSGGMAPHAVLTTCGAIVFAALARANGRQRMQALASVFAVVATR